MGLAILTSTTASRSCLMPKQPFVTSIGGSRVSDMVAPSRMSGRNSDDDPVVLVIVLEVENDSCIAADDQQHEGTLTSKLRIHASECTPQHLTRRSTTSKPSKDPVVRRNCIYTAKQLRQRIRQHLHTTVSPDELRYYQHADLEITVEASNHLVPLDNDTVNILTEFGSRLRVQARWKHSSSASSRPLLSITGRYYDFTGSITVCGTTLQINEIPNQHNAGTSFNVWDGSLLLAQYLAHNPHHVRNRHVLELGAGCGLAGLAAAAAGATHVTLTDREGPPLDHLQANATLNEPTTLASLHVTALDWSNRQHTTWLAARQYHAVLVADCVWTDEQVEPLLNVLRIATQLDATTTTTTEDSTSCTDAQHDQEQVLETPSLSLSELLLRRKTTRDEQSSTTLDESHHDDFVRGQLQRANAMGDDDFPSFLDDDDDEEEEEDDDEITSFHEDDPVEATEVIIAYQRRGNSTHQALWKGLRSLFRSIEHAHVPDQPDVLSILVCRR